MATERIPPTLIVALAPHLHKQVEAATPSPSSSLPVASSSYLVRLSSSNHNTPSHSARSSDSVDPASAMAAITLSPSPTPPPMGAAPPTESSSGDNRQNRHSSTSSDGPSSDDHGYNQRDSFAKSSAAGGGNRLGTVSENGETPGPGAYYRRESHTSTFGRGISGPNSPEPSDRARSMDTRASPSLLGAEDQLTPGRPSLAASDALRRQSLLSNADPLRSKELLPPSEKQELARASYEDPDTRPVSGSYRLTLKTTNESTNAYTGYGSSNGHSDFKKAYVSRSTRCFLYFY